jgi:hypothetical protein
VSVTLRRNATDTRPLASWGFVSASLATRSCDDDEFIGALEGDVTAAAPFTPGDTIEIFVAGTRKFSGKVTQLRASGTGRIGRWQLTVSGPWYDLKRLMYQQEMAAYDASCIWSGTIKTTKVVLFQDALLGTSTTLGAQITAVLTYAVLKGVNIATGLTPTFDSAPFDSARDLTVADVIRRCIQYIPDAVAWVDYSSATPVLNVARRTSLTTASLDLDDTAPGITAFEIYKRADLIPAGVRFNYIGQKSCPLRIAPGCVDPATGLTNSTGVSVASTQTGNSVTITQDESGLPDTPGGIIGTIDLAQLADSTTEAAPIGLAGAYYLALLVAQYEGFVTLHEEQVTGTLRPGKLLNIANGATEWATMAAMIQQVDEDLVTGETIARFGPPEHLSPQDFVALMQFARRRPFVQNSFAATRFPGTDDTPNCEAAKDPTTKSVVDALKSDKDAAANALGLPGSGTATDSRYPTISIALCADGEAKTATVWGTIDG